MRLRPALLAVALFSALPGQTLGQTPGALDGLDAYIRAAMADWQIPGLAVAVVKDGEVVFLRGYGVRQVGTPARVNGNTVFEFGGASRSFTATAVAVLVSDGKVTWDDPVIKYVPWLEFADPFVTRHVTLRDLLSHRVAGGWAGTADAFIGMFAHTPQEILRALAWRPSVGRLPGPGRSAAEFRSRFLVESTNYFAAAEVIAAVTGTPYKEFVQSRILRPLKMASAVTGARDLWYDRAVAPCFECGIGNHTVTLDDARVANVAARHRRGERGPETIPVFDTGDGASGLWLSAADAARWLLFQTGGGSIDGIRLLSARVFDETHTAQVSIAPETDLRPSGGTLGAFGLGWFLTDYHGRHLSFHAGAGTAFTALLRDERVGVAVLTNAAPNELREALAFRVLDALIGVPPRDWSAEMLESARRREGEARLRAAAAPPPPPPAAAPLPLSAYVGTYSHPAFGDVSVIFENDRLVLRIDRGQIGDLVSLGDHRFRVTWRGPDHYRGVVTFATRDSRSEQLTLQFPGVTFTRK
jgi:CubicO group peptidase (beta-lactamase class C family)